MQHNRYKYISENTNSVNTNIKGIKMLDFISAYFSQWFDDDSTLHEYGSDLERYILAHNPQSVHEIEQLTRQFENTLTQGR